MPRGRPITPEQLATATAVYARTGNYSEAARAIGVETSTVSRALQRGGEQQRATLHARAIERGMRAGRRQLASALDAGPARLAAAATGQEYAAVVGALARATEVIMRLAERAEERGRARLTRAKTRAEIELIRATVAGKLPPGSTVALSSEAFGDLFAKHFGGPPSRTPRVLDAPAESLATPEKA